MAKEKRNRTILDDIADGIDRALKDLERLINGQRKPTRVLVPIPVESDPRRSEYDPRR